ncbi:MAG TPA: DUF692 domain-containing protein [Polyangiaceae bacterium LLY-WYZ-15_(1-7)]|nr:hypothetical protein [Myxococcales bacterium]MAT25669.1 hypothetical protein [Sandaracinus sp.]HJK89173.1 DUF692 domain-containing protein [Polyangiaceae bacterium LLY-WYZ-15_(1-7)]MBJ74270.1 hypothetical protein [Sandaracinus sp.]HJL00239.1 DUF692 domain-containing protein [Polyangiaceae bacterium LLY-WYZ-15_(1-7)]
MRGVGIGLRRPLAEAVLETDRRIDWLEIVPENFLGKAGPFSRALARAAERFPIGAHGVSMSLGGPDAFDPDLFRALRGLLDRLGIERYTEHLSFSNVGGFHSHDLLALPFHEDAVRWAAARIREAAERLGRPLDVENPSTYVAMPGSEMGEGEFVSAVVEEADCGLLLDVNNVFVSAFNHGTDPVALLEAMPLERTTRIHVAGHLDLGDLCVDDHGHPIRAEVFDLLARALRRTGEVPVLLEWDTNIPPLDRVLDEADRVREVVERALAERSSRRAMAPRMEASPC